MKKLLSLAIALTMFGTLLVGCGGDSSSSSEAPVASTPEASTPDEPASTPDDGDEGGASGKITLSTWDLDTQTTYIQTVVDAFEAATDIEVEIIDLASDSYVDKLNIDLNGGAAADVIMIKEADGTFAFAQKGQLADMSEFISRDGVDLGQYNGLAENFNFDGEQVALPVRTDYYILYYNTDIFDDAEIDYPSNDMTWAEFQELAAQLTSGSGTDKIYGAHFHTWQALAANWGIQDGKNTIMGPDYSFLVEPYEMLLDLQNNGYIQDYATLSSASIHYSSAFQQGNIAMMPMGSWFMSTMIKAVNDGETEVNWAVATIPHPEGVEAGYTVGSPTPVAINNASDNKDAAWEFVKFLTGEEGSKILADAGQFPGNVNNESLKAITSVDGMPEGALDALQVKNISPDRPSVEYVGEVDSMMSEEHQLIMLGENSLEDGIAAITERSKEIQGLD